ncbi:MAG TPA: ATP-binding protein, partial [Candidatus Blautia faecavium]|nr:ATP-binding protein [Candidatus Blautia faecavium]
IKDVDITTIFANLLDNAIEAAKATASPYLKLKIQEVHSFRVISLVNSSSLEHKKSGHMGLGLENVRHTVEKYSGTINWEQFPHKFQTSILLPRKENL